MEKIFWAVCMVIVLGAATYVTVEYATRYLKYDVRTEIRYIENDTITLPVITMCHSGTFKESYVCYKNKTLGTNETCREFQVNNSYIRHDNWKKGENTYLGRHCHVFNPNGTFAVTGKTEYMNVDYYYNGPHWNKGIFVIFQSPEEFAATNMFGHLTYMNAYERPAGLMAFEIFLEKTTISRKQHPYPSKCINKHSTSNPLSSIYTKASCQEMCAMEYMYAECQDVVDVWKNFLGRDTKPFQNAHKYKSREQCFWTVIDQVVRRFPPNCSCPLSCTETVIRSKFVGVPTPLGDAALKMSFYYKEKRVTSITEIEDYPIQDLLGAFGGILGLCIGMSVMSLLEIALYLVFLLLNCMT